MRSHSLSMLAAVAGIAAIAGAEASAHPFGGGMGSRRKREHQRSMQNPEVDAARIAQAEAKRERRAAKRLAHAKGLP